jgi:hypothetical protein
MKRIFTLLAFTAFSLSIFAQSPDLMTYQAVLRDAQDELITNQAVAIQISIMQTTPNSTPVYMEVHSVNTNANGLVSLEIGAGVTTDDFSLIDWANGPFFLKTETDPNGGTNYTISSTTQLLSVPYSKYADEAGNVFSGDYADLAGAPTNVSTFTNDAGYLTNISGSEPAFNNWDKNVADDFSGNYGDLLGAPTNVSFFTNDAGYLTSQYWLRNGSNLYYSAGNVGIGMSNPIHLLDINGGGYDTWTSLFNNATGATMGDGLLLGIRNDFHSFLWNYETGPLIFGTNSLTRMTIDASGNVAIGPHLPGATLDVQGSIKFGSNGITFTEIREITGTTSSTYYTVFTLPSGYNETNTRVLSFEINYGDYGWVGLGLQIEGSPSPVFGVSYLLDGDSMYIYYPGQTYFYAKAFRILVMQVAP